MCDISGVPQKLDLLLIVLNVRIYIHNELTFKLDSVYMQYLFKTKVCIIKFYLFREKYSK